LWLRDVKDDTKGPHLLFWGGGPTAFHTALISLMLHLQFLFKFPTPGPAPPKSVESTAALRVRDHLWLILQA